MSQEWRNHPALQGKLHPEHPDDVQVVVHDGGPRISNRGYEMVWVTITGQESYPFGDVFTGTVLNQPHQLQSVRIQQSIKFFVPDNFPIPILVTDKYLAERADWSICICPACGLSELFDAPSDLIRKAFPNIPAGAVMDKFTSFCPSCLEAMVISHRNSPGDPYRFPIEVQRERREPFTAPPPPPRKWWQFRKEDPA